MSTCAGTLIPNMHHNKCKHVIKGVMRTQLICEVNRDNILKAILSQEQYYLVQKLMVIIELFIFRMAH